MKFIPSDFSNNHYDCRIVMQAQNNDIVLVLRKKDYMLLPWCVMRGYSSCYFATRKEALAFCDKYGYTVPQPPPGIKKSQKTPLKSTGAKVYKYKRRFKWGIAPKSNYIDQN